MLVFEKKEAIVHTFSLLWRAAQVMHGVLKMMFSLLYDVVGFFEFELF